MAIGKIDFFLNAHDIPNNYVLLDGRSVSKTHYPQLWNKINFSPKLYPEFTLTDTDITVPDWTDYYLKQDKKALGVKNIDTIRDLGDDTPSTDIDIFGSFPILSGTTDMYPPDDFIKGRFYIDHSTPPDGTTTFLVRDPNSDAGHPFLQFKWNKMNFSYQQSITKISQADNEHVSDITEPQNIGVLYAICASDTLYTYGVLYPDGTGKKYADNTYNKTQDCKK